MRNEAQFGEEQEFIHFGRHRGEKWSDLPSDYLQWIMDSLPSDADWKRNAKKRAKREAIRRINSGVAWDPNAARLDVNEGDDEETKPLPDNITDFDGPLMGGILIGQRTYAVVEAAVNGAARHLIKEWIRDGYRKQEDFVIWLSTLAAQADRLGQTHPDEVNRVQLHLGLHFHLMTARARSMTLIGTNPRLVEILCKVVPPGTSENT